MNSQELVKKTITGDNHAGIVPIYGWVSANLSEPITQQFGSVQNFEDTYKFDMAHLFGGPSFATSEISALHERGEAITPEMALELPLSDPDKIADYDNVREQLKHHRDERGRFCYMQTPGIFEALNGIFGIENHLFYLAAYPELVAEVYRRQAAWNIRFINNMIDLGLDMIHISDDWGAQNGLMFNPETTWRELIYPNHKMMVEAVHSRGVLCSLHSDGNNCSVLDGIAELGYNLFHPYQESAGMDYNVYLERYSDKFAILGGLCVQSTIGFNDFGRLESEIRRVFATLRGRRWCFCTTHFVQAHCSMEELVFAYDLADKLRNP